MVCYKMNLSFRCIYKWACPHITFAHKGIAERKKANTESCSIQFARIFFVPVLGFICLIDSNFFSRRKIPFTVLTIKYKVLSFIPHFGSFYYCAFTFCFNYCR